MNQPDEPTGRPSMIPYATPGTGQDKRFEWLVVIVFLAAGAAVGIVFLAGMSWPTALVIACLCFLCICFGHFFTRHPG